MNGSPVKMGTISGTAGHGSALKMKVEANAASALKQTEPKMLEKDWKKGQESAKSSGRDLDALVKSRKGLKKGSDEYNVVQNQINKALGDKTKHGVKSSTSAVGGKTTTSKVVPGLSTEVKSETEKKRLLGGSKKVTKSKFEDDEGITTRKSKTISNKEGTPKRTKKVIKTDFDKDGKTDKKSKIKVNKKGDTKKVTKEGGRRTVTKTKDGVTTTKSRRTLKGFLTGKGKKKKEDSPADMKDKY